MPHTSAERYRQLFEYEKATQLKLMTSLNDAVERVGPDPLKNAIKFMFHMLLARRLWLFRLGHSKEVPNFQQPNISLTELKANMEDVHAVWSEYFATLDENELSRICDYRTTEGEPYRTTVEDILTQLYGHSLHHGGQIAYVLREAGYAPPETDFIFAVRKRI